MIIVVEPSAYDGPEEAHHIAAWLVQQGRQAVVDTDFSQGDQIWPDVWTTPLDPRLQSRQVSCLADELLRTRDVIGITGSAGKTTTAWLTSQLLPATLQHRARAQNLWPGSSLLEKRGTIVAELTSSHLAFCHHSPRVAAITNFWPDHLEIHGGLKAYAEAKGRIFRFQSARDIAVLPWHDQAARALAEGSPARRAWFSLESRPPEAEVRVWPHLGGIRVETSRQTYQLALQPEPALLCALAVAAASGLEWSLPAKFERPAHRAARSGRLIDDTLAATPRKASYGLTPGTHLVAGGLLEIGGQRVHDSHLEQAAVQEWLDRIRQNCLSVDLFGPAGEWMSEQLAGSRLHPDLLSAVGFALSQCAGTVLVSPGFPMLQEQRLLLQKSEFLSPGNY